MTRPLPRPTDVELRILEVFWDLGPSTVRAVHHCIIKSPDRADTSYSTTLKMIQVLHEKGFLKKDSSVRPQIYTTTVSRAGMQRRVMEDVAHRLFGGAMTDLVQCVISSDAVSLEELNEMQRLIRQAKRGDRS